MKKTGLIIFLLFASQWSMAQSRTPEFELRLHLSNADGTPNNDPVGFGYDPLASVPTDTTLGYDSAFGEMYYPAQPFAGDYFLAFQIDSFGDYSEINILPKPATDTFTLQYPIFVSMTKYPATLSWTGTIPSQVKGIVVSPAYHPEIPLVDMTKQTSVTITSNVTDKNYYSNWEPAIITIYYNIAPPALGVSEAPAASSGLLYGLDVYPNPIQSNGNVSFSLSEAAKLTIAGFDALGRQLFSIEREGAVGENTVDVSQGLRATNGSVLLRIEAISASQSETQSVLAIKE